MHLTGAVLSVTISAVAHGGDGIAQVNGRVCFVSGALPGDQVRIRIWKQTERALWGRVLEMETPSPDRLPDDGCTIQPCRTACKWRTFAYPAQGIWKQRIVQESLRRIGGIEAEVRFSEEPDLRLGYRTRATFHGDGVHLGYYAERSHDVIALDACPLNHVHLNFALAGLRAFKLTGDVHVTVNPEGEEMLVWLNEPTESLRKRFPLANDFKDKERSCFIFDGAPIVNGVFSQAGLLLNRMLRREVKKAVGHPDRLLDLYCGNGNLSLEYCEHCRVTGVDHAGPGIAAASQMTSGVYLRGNETLMCRQLQEHDWDVVLLDPPRAGAKAIVEALRKARARRIVYVSCDPATLARDIKGMVAGDWRAAAFTVLDLFPHTPHVETIGVLERT
jgi:23S rRNA (uracil1939-C5)-methyltransferase